jgi:integrase
VWDCIQPPRLYTHERYPQGPPWAQVRELLDAANTQRPKDVRDRAMMLLMAIYGFRAGEVSNLRLEDIDWENGVIRPRRPKQRRVGTYPLTRTVGEAIIAYLEIRPICRHREIFISMLQPYRPFAPRGSLASIVTTRQKALGQELSRYGPHGLRHACATHLLAEGFTLKQIGDHLGHTLTEATEVYAKVDVSGLMQVGDVDLRELIEFSAACERRETKHPHLTCPEQCAWFHKCRRRRLP